MSGQDNPAGGPAGPGGGPSGPPGQEVGGPGGGPPGGMWTWIPVSSDSEVEPVEHIDQVAPLVDESIERKFDLAFSVMKSLNPNGVVMNKLLAWMEIQKDMIPPNTWKAHLKTLYTDDDIIEAKTVLFESVGGDSTRIGKFKNHHVKEKHLEDLIDAAGKLWNNNEMPLVVASSKMIKGMRNYNMVDADNVNLADAINKIKQVEDTLKACIVENTNQVKNLAEVVGSVGQGPSSHLQQNRAVSNSRISSLITQNQNGETPGKKRKLTESNQMPGIQPLCEREQLYPSLPATDQPMAWNTVTARQHQPKQHQGEGQQQVRPTGGQQAAGDAHQTPRQRGAWKKSLNILHGTADMNNTIAADVSLVAYGVAKDASEDRLKSFLQAKNINVIECKKLTTFQQARTHCYKVTIKASEFEKATKPEVWPYRVGVRLFKQFREKKDETPSWNDQQNTGRTNQPQPQQKNQSHHFNPPVAPPVTPLATNNRYSALTTDAPADFNH